MAAQVQVVRVGSHEGKGAIYGATSSAAATAQQATRVRRARPRGGLRLWGGPVGGGARDDTCSSWPRSSRMLRPSSIVRCTQLPHMTARGGKGGPMGVCSIARCTQLQIERVCARARR
eukprot:2032633-Prymnesium_polylepis.1